ncbi:bifunctional diguanylate cyclase/phosphodiesterase [Skermania sp. ID1734]|uniref:putative bifunctional diguanylate cyclase/phosphodiesterase n=1 Tax=Skermania sp. ID1734 TaxID=2597516 RepID=UPI00163D9CA6|nr:EAL domain-containing protein [Skermania sp. ID1734]
MSATDQHGMSAALEAVATHFDAAHAFVRFQHASVAGLDAEWPAGSPEQDLVTAGSEIRLPLVSSDNTIGVLVLVRANGREWMADEVRTLTDIAELMVLTHSRLDTDTQLRFIAAHDDLTGLCNRRALLQHLNARLAPGQPGPVAVLFLDLDRLKALNDFLGHAAGDNFIEKLALRLREHAGPGDMVARLGGDEFVIVPAFPLEREQAEIEARRITQLVREKVTVGEESVSRAVSVGVALGIPGRTAVADLLRHADQAVMVAKAAGGNGIAVFTDQMLARDALRAELETQLRGAISAGELRVHYQPEVELQTGRVVALEALVRWQHPERGLLTDPEFLEIAEATNLAGEIGRWVIRTAVGDFAGWRHAGLAERVQLRISVSPVQLVSLQFLATMRQALAEFGLSGRTLCVEIPERVISQDLARTRVTLDGLAALGIRVTVAAFGRGASSLAQLGCLDIDALKIDPAFVQRVGSGAEPSGVAAVKSIVAIADSHDLGVIAEGVDTSAARQRLLELGCRHGQGALFGAPLDCAGVPDLLTRGCVSVSQSRRG